MSSTAGGNGFSLSVWYVHIYNIIKQRKTNPLRFRTAGKQRNISSIFHVRFQMPIWTYEARFKNLSYHFLNFCFISGRNMFAICTRSIMRLDFVNRFILLSEILLEVDTKWYYFIAFLVWHRIGHIPASFTRRRV